MQRATFRQHFRPCKEQQMKFWVPKSQEWQTLDEMLYLKLSAAKRKDQREREADPSGRSEVPLYAIRRGGEPVAPRSALKLPRLSAMFLLTTDD